MAKKRKSNKTGMIMGIAVAAIVVIVLVICFIQYVDRLYDSVMAFYVEEKNKYRLYGSSYCDILFKSDVA